MKLNEKKFDDQNEDDESKRGDKSVFGYNSFFDISSLKLFTSKNVTSLTPWRSKKEKSILNLHKNDDTYYFFFVYM